MFLLDGKSASERKQYPLVAGCLMYFPDALLEVAHVSYIGNEQHNPGQPLHWDRSKSTDELDALGRHLMAHGTLDSDKIRHSAKLAWRALANLQKELEAEYAAGSLLQTDLQMEKPGKDLAAIDTLDVMLQPGEPSDPFRKEEKTDRVRCEASDSWSLLTLGQNVGGK